MYRAEAEQYWGYGGHAPRGAWISSFGPFVGAGTPGYWADWLTFGDEASARAFAARVNEGEFNSFSGDQLRAAARDWNTQISLPVIQTPSQTIYAPIALDDPQMREQAVAAINLQPPTPPPWAGPVLLVGAVAVVAWLVFE